MEDPMSGKDKRFIFEDVTVLIADGVKDLQGDLINIEDVKVYPSVPIFLNFDREKVLGRATLKKVAKEVRADIIFVDDFDNRRIINIVVDILTAKLPLVPCVGGYKKDDMYSVECIGLSHRNVDERIKPLPVRPFEKAKE